MSTIHPIIDQVGAWQLHPFGLNAMTTNQSEAYPPPAGKRLRRTVVNWIGCEQCPRWFHNVCVRVKSIADRYVCGNCE